MIENPQDFIAWSIYTGPANTQQITDFGIPWVTGEWSAVNTNITAVQIKNDIEQRIGLLVRVFNENAKKLFKTKDRHFVVPEFFFRCKQGPYPNVLLTLKDEKHYPFEYIRRRLIEEFTAIGLESEGNRYTIFFGTTLTCNVPGDTGFESFLKSEAVLRRLGKLNTILKKIEASPGFSGKMEKPIFDYFDYWARFHVHNDDIVKSFDFPTNFFLNANRESDDAGINDGLMELLYFMADCKCDPLCTVRNRGISLHLDPKDEKPKFFMHEKQYESTIDLPIGSKLKDGVLEAPGQITEWMANYPSSTIIYGDKQPAGGNSIKSRIQKQSSFRIQGAPHQGRKSIDIYVPGEDIGIEICFDHATQRLRRTVDMKKSNGATADNYPLSKQVIPSGGMQLVEYAICTKENSPIFNADGLLPVFKGMNGDKVEKIGDGTCSYKGSAFNVYSLSRQNHWSKWGPKYYSHSQLAFTTEDSHITAYNMADGVKNTMAKTYNTDFFGCPTNPITNAYIVKNAEIEMQSQDSGLFAAGTGELHHYLPNTC